MILVQSIFARGLKATPDAFAATGGGQEDHGGAMVDQGPRERLAAGGDLEIGRSESALLHVACEANADGGVG